MTFGEWLRTCRLNAGLSQKRLADALHFSQTYISALERKQKAPEAATLHILENYFNIRYYQQATTKQDEERRLELARWYLKCLKEGEDGD